MIPAKETNGSSRPAGSDTLGRVRGRGVFVMEALLWAAAGGFLLILGGYFLVLLNFSAVGAERFRRILGGGAPITGPDWYALTIIGLGVLLPVCGLGALIAWYMRVWKDRLKLIWRGEKDRKRFGRIRIVPKVAGVGDRDERTEYLRHLLASDEWRPDWPAMKKEAGVKDISSDTLAPEDYERAAAAVWKNVQADAMDRALATGLIVGLSGNRAMDQITILIASLELQLHVLTRLGKTPGWRTWRKLLQRALGSLFINTYLTREDAFGVQFIIKKTAMGLQVLSELVDQGAEHLGNIDVEHVVHSFDADEALEGSHHVADHAGDALKTAGRVAGMAVDTHAPGLGTLGAEAFIALAKGGAKVGIAFAEFSLKTGATGLHLIGTFIEHYGRELTQGVAAGAMLYLHGAELASDCLALDENHRQGMNPGFAEILHEMAKHAGNILLDQVKQLRGLFKDRRKRPVELVKAHLKRGSNQSGTSKSSKPVASP